MDLKFILESLLFSAQKPLSVKELRDVLAATAEQEDADATVKALKKIKESEMTSALEQLTSDHEAAGRRPLQQMVRPFDSHPFLSFRSWELSRALPAYTSQTCAARHSS